MYSCLSNTSDLGSLMNTFDYVANKPANIENIKDIL